MVCGFGELDRYGKCNEAAVKSTYGMYFFGKKQRHHRNRINDNIRRAWIYHSTLFIYAKRNKQSTVVWTFSQSLCVENPRIRKN